VEDALYAVARLHRGLRQKDAAYATLDAYRRRFPDGR
jgi:TolA-binding protein